MNFTFNTSVYSQFGPSRRRRQLQLANILHGRYLQLYIPGQSERPVRLKSAGWMLKSEDLSAEISLLQMVLRDTATRLLAASRLSLVLLLCHVRTEARAWIFRLYEPPLRKLNIPLRSQHKGIPRCRFSASIFFPRPGRWLPRSMLLLPRLKSPFSHQKKRELNNPAISSGEF